MELTVEQTPLLLIYKGLRSERTSQEAAFHLQLTADLLVIAHKTTQPGKSFTCNNSVSTDDLTGDGTTGSGGRAAEGLMTELPIEVATDIPTRALTFVINR